VILVIIDLIPALLMWEGRDRSSPLELAPDGVEAVSHLYSHYRLVGIADAGVAVDALRSPLDGAGIGDLFDRVGTSAPFGPRVNPRVLRRVAATRPHHPPAVLVTGRETLARTANRSRMSVVVSSFEDFGGVPEAVALLLGGRVSP